MSPGARRFVIERWQRALVLFEDSHTPSGTVSLKACRSMSGTSGRVLAQHVWDSLPAALGRLESALESASVSVVSLGKQGKRSPLSEKLSCRAS